MEINDMNLNASSIFRHRFMAIVFAWMFFVPHLSTQAESPLEIAMDTVKTLKAGANLKTIGLKVAPRTQTYGMIVAQIGSDAARALVEKELELALPDFQNQWDKNLSESYLEHLSVNELKSITKQRRNSPHLRKFILSQRKIGATMQENSKDLLNKFVTQALTSAYTKTLSSNK